MSSINGLGGTAPIQPTTVTPKTTAPTDAAKPSATDRLELSGMSHLMKSLQTTGGVRVDKVASIKAQIEAGTYEDDHKIDSAINSLLDDLDK